MSTSTTPLIEVICVAYKREGPLKVLVQSFLNQTAANWKLSVLHDGPDNGVREVMKPFLRERPKQIAYRAGKQRHNDWGHTLRDEGLRNATSDYVLLTNDDNYYVPKFVELVTEAIVGSNADVILYDMVHSHERPGGRPLPAYSYFQTAFRRFEIDIGAAVVRTSLARAVGFRDRTHDGDATYFEDLSHAANLLICKIDRVLFVHN
jgi:glycosyltransferase involved in cell wall biosynthesis